MAEEVNVDNIGDKPKAFKSHKKKKNFERSQHHFKPRDQRKEYDGAKHVRKRKRLEDLVDQLESLKLKVNYFESDDENFVELTPFDCLFIEEENMEIWQNFINLPEEKQYTTLKNTFICQDDKAEYVSSHFAFNRIGFKLRSFLKRNRFSIERLKTIEKNLIDYFVENPMSIYITTIPDAYERLVFHAVSQYLDLNSSSFFNKGKRKTKAFCKKNYFLPPQNTLADHIQGKTTFVEAV